MIPNRFSKTIRIPIRIENGQPKFFYAGELPKLAEGAVGDLVLYAHAILRKEDRELLDVERDRELLPTGTRLLIEVSQPSQQPGVVTLQFHEVDSHVNTFVEVHLREPLRLQLRSTKKARLLPCHCQVTALDRITGSLNQACTIVSEAFEPWRTSHSGNAFHKVLHCTTSIEGDFWRPLDTLRGREEAALERLLFKLRNDTDRTHANMGG
jgi:hypothetical protein